MTTWPSTVRGIVLVAKIITSVLMQSYLTSMDSSCNQSPLLKIYIYFNVLFVLKKHSSGLNLSIQCIIFLYDTKPHTNQDVCSILIMKKKYIILLLDTQFILLLYIHKSYVSNSWYKHNILIQAYLNLIQVECWQCMCSVCTGQWTVQCSQNWVSHV